MPLNNLELMQACSEIVQLLHFGDPFNVSFACKFPICGRDLLRCRLKHLLFNFIDKWMGHGPTAQLGSLRIATYGFYTFLDVSHEISHLTSLDSTWVPLTSD